MVILDVSAIIIWVLALLGDVVIFHIPILVAIGWTILLSVCYTSSFVILSTFSEAPGKKVETYLKISRQCQGCCLRYGAYCCIFFALATVVVVLYVSTYPLGFILSL